MLDKEKAMKTFENLSIPQSSQELSYEQVVDCYKSICYDSGSELQLSFDVDMIRSDSWDVYWQATVYVDNLFPNDKFRTNYPVIIDTWLEYNDREDWDDLHNRLCFLEEHAQELLKHFNS